jgi:hypothetical protein
VCLELHAVAREASARADWIRKPNRTLRVAVGAIIVVTLAVLAFAASQATMSGERLTIADIVQMTEAGLNEVVLIGAALLFLVTVESRMKRARALAALDELRSIAHVIDMHQLTKDPEMPQRRIVTPSSPARGMTGYELTRYLDYCSEMLSLTGKIAALYAQGFRDTAVLAAVNEIEAITTGLNGKIWQKIMIQVGRMERDAQA